MRVFGLSRDSVGCDHGRLMIDEKRLFDYSDEYEMRADGLYYTVPLI